MIALPPGRGRGAARKWLSGVVAYAVAAPAGAALTGLILHLTGAVAGRPPVQAVGLLAVLAALSGSGLVRFPLPTSTWALPQRWSRFGHAGYAGLFGVLLGLGVVTVASSVGLYALLAFALAEPRINLVLLVFVTFGLARALPLISSSMGGTLLKLQQHDVLERLSACARWALPVEIALLTATAVLFLLPEGM